MLLQLFEGLRNAGVPVSLTEYLSLLRGLERGVVDNDVEQFYHFARIALVKDEQYYDRFDAVFATFYNGVQNAFGEISATIPDEWLRKQLERHLSDEEKALVQSLGGWEKLMETLQQRLGQIEDQSGAIRRVESIGIQIGVTLLGPDSKACRCPERELLH